MFKAIRPISVFLLVILSLAACGGKKEHYPEPYQLSGPKPGKEGEVVKVAFLLPLSGQYQPLGKAMLDAAHLALFDANISNLEIVPLDTQDSNTAADKAAQDALNGGAKLILGPVFSATTERVAPIAARKQVNIISLSNDYKLAGKPGLYLLGHNPKQQIERVTRYATERGIKDFAALVPSNAYGNMAVAAYQNTVKDSQGRLQKMDYYAPSAPAEKLRQQTETVVASLPDRTGAILAPEGAERIRHITSPASSPRNIKWLGSSQWNDATVLTMPGLTGGWFADTDPAKQEAFTQRFNDVYGYAPPRVASLAYDAVALAANLAAQGDFSREALTAGRGFAGAEGIFRFREDGANERGLAVLQVSSGQAKIIEAAPTKFR